MNMNELATWLNNNHRISRLPLLLVLGCFLAKKGWETLDTCGGRRRNVNLVTFYEFYKGHKLEILGKKWFGTPEIPLFEYLAPLVKMLGG